MPITNILVVFMVLAIAGFWSTRGKGRGLLSSLLACLCVLVAGAVALSAWEPLVYGFLLEWNEDLAWMLGLIVPFIATLFVLRIVIDNTIRANIDLDDVTNFAGGLVFGLVSAVVTSGIVMLGLGTLRIGENMLGFEPVEDKNGSFVYERTLWIPVDLLTARLYEHLSLGAFSTPDPLALRMPDAHEHVAMMRASYRDATSSSKASLGRTVVQPGDFAVKGRYEIQGSLDELLGDTFTEGSQRNVTYPDGTTPRNGAHIEGYIIEFQPGAIEKKSGKMLIMGSQTRLVLKQVNADHARAIHPFAIIAASEASSDSMHRFRLVGKDYAMQSWGGTTKSSFIFEFLVPNGYQATDLFVKGTRVDFKYDLANVSPAPIASPDVRDDKIRDLSLFTDVGVRFGKVIEGEDDTSGSSTISESKSREIIVSRSTFPGRWLLSAQTARSRFHLNDKNRITGTKGSGTATLSKQDFDNRGLDAKLRVNAFAVTKDTGIIQVIVLDRGRESTLGRAFRRVEDILPPILTDTKGTQYECIGFMYDNLKEIRIRYTPGRPVRALSEVPQYSPNQRDETLYLLFRPTKGAKISRFQLGSKSILDFDPPVQVR